MVKNVKRVNNKGDIAPLKSGNTQRDSERDDKHKPTLSCDQFDVLCMPTNVSHYLSTKTFNQTSVPKGLLAAHSTKAATWGKIIVKSGELDYVIDELDNEKVRLQPGIDGIIAPEMVHHLEIVGPVEFYVAFYAKGK